MAKKMQRSVAQDADGDTGVVPGESLFDAMADDTYVNLKRRDERTKQWVYQGRLSPSEANEEYIAATYGGGEYLAAEKVRSGDSGKYVFSRQRTIKIGGAYKGVPVERTAADGTAAVGRDMGDGVKDSGGAVKMDDLMMSQFVQMMQMNNAVMKSVIETARPSGPAVDWGAVLGVVVPSITTLLAAVLQGNQAKRDPVEIATEIVDKMQANTAPAHPLKERMEEMRMMKDMAEFFGGGGGGEESWPSLIGKFGPDILQALQGAKAVDQGHAAPSPQALPPAATQERTMLDVVAGYLPKLVTVAAIGRDPVTYATVIVDNIAAPFRPHLRQLVEMPNVVDLLIARHPPMGQYRQWLTELVEAIRGEVGEGPVMEAVPPSRPQGVTREPTV